MFAGVAPYKESPFNSIEADNVLRMVRHDFGKADPEAEIAAYIASRDALVAEIRALNASGRFRTHVFAGSECDILADGRLDFEPDVLRTLDYVVASVHNALSQDEATMTARIIRAIEHPCTTMLGHPTGRLLLRREASRVDLAKVIDAAIAHGVIIELKIGRAHV